MQVRVQPSGEILVEQQHRARNVFLRTRAGARAVFEFAPGTSAAVHAGNQLEVIQTSGEES